MKHDRIVSRDEWLAARKRHLGWVRHHDRYGDD